MESEAGIESTLDSQHPVAQDQSILSKREIPDDIGESSRLRKWESKRDEKVWFYHEFQSGNMRRMIRKNWPNFHPISQPNSYSRSAIFQNWRAQILRRPKKRCCVQERRKNQHFPICNICIMSSVKELKVSWKVSRTCRKPAWIKGGQLRLPSN